MSPALANECQSEMGLSPVRCVTKKRNCPGSSPVHGIGHNLSRYAICLWSWTCLLLQVGHSMNEHAHMLLRIHHHFLMPKPRKIPLHQSARVHFPLSTLKLRSCTHYHNKMYIRQSVTKKGQAIISKQKYLKKTLTSHSMSHPWFR